jgi:myxalamid-type polyketide synthase MxaE and MxaD
VLGQGRTQLGVMPLNVRQWRQYYPKVAQWPFLAVLAQEEERSRRRPGASSQVLQALRAAAPRDRQVMLEEHLREQITQVLQVASSRLEAHTPLTSLGLDSLMALKLRNRLEASLGLALPTTLLWRYPTVAALVPHLAGKLELPLEAAEPSAPRPATQEPAHESLAQELEKLSQDELAAILAQELADIEESSR